MKKVLVIDASLTVRMDLDEAFRAAGWDAVLCGSASAAREALRHSAPDALVLGVMLPDGNGLELLREMRSNARLSAVPVLLLASQEEVSAALEPLCVAPEAFLAKPYDKGDLLARAERLSAGPRLGPGATPVSTVLAVDDSLTYLNELAAQLRADGHTVLEARSGSEALQAVAAHTPDCVLLDMLMPGMSGQEVCCRIKQAPAWRSVAVIMLTGREDHEAIVESFNAGADDYVAKSSDWAVLKARLAAQLRRRHVEKETLRMQEALHRRELEIAEARATLAERARVEEELRAAKISAERAKAAAEDASRAKDHFLAVLSHELRTPLTPVLASLALLEREELPLRAQDRLELIHRNVQLQSRLIDDLLDVTRIVRGKVELDRRPIDLFTIIDRAADVCRPDIEARRLEFGIDYGRDRFVIEADAARLQQVFWNLIKNSIKFTPLGGCVGLRCRSEPGYAVIQVNDSGIGFAPEASERIFDAFAQAEASITRQFGGLGLGLAISKALVEMHGGTIAARSEGLNRGATFIVRLPAQLAGAASEPAPPAKKLEAAGRNKRRILLVEDHGDTAETMVSLLELFGHRVQRAGDVAAALTIAGQGEFDLLISDLGLPDGSGLDLIRKLRGRGLAFPAIALSGYGQEKDLAQSRSAGFQLHLVKPIEPAQLLEAIDAVYAPGSAARES
jgi:two-component system NtrC family sensor kinase